jgi:hypothetical protein
VVLDSDRLNRMGTFLVSARDMTRAQIAILAALIEEHLLREIAEADARRGDAAGHQVVNQPVTPPARAP